MIQRQRSASTHLVKKKLMEWMFTEDAAPKKCNAIYAAIQAEAAMKIFGCQNAPVDLLMPVMDMANSIRKVFKTQANETVNRLFDEDFIAYRAEKVNIREIFKYRYSQIYVCI